MLGKVLCQLKNSLLSLSIAQQYFTPELVLPKCLKSLTIFKIMRYFRQPSQSSLPNLDTLMLKFHRTYFDPSKYRGSDPITPIKVKHLMIEAKYAAHFIWVIRSVALPIETLEASTEHMYSLGWGKSLQVQLENLLKHNLPSNLARCLFKFREIEYYVIEAVQKYLDCLPKESEKGCIFRCLNKVVLDDRMNQRVLKLLSYDVNSSCETKPLISHFEFGRAQMKAVMKNKQEI